MNDSAFEERIARLNKADRLHPVVSEFCMTGRAYTPGLSEQNMTPTMARGAVCMGWQEEKTTEAVSYER